MDNALNSIQNKALAGILSSAPHHVAGAIRQASARTGVDFAYLVQQAAAESSFRPAAKSKSSSATGLYQFIESTWLSMVKKYGAKHGMADMAARIDSSGRVSSRAARREILALRNDPEKASAMAAEFASENRKFLEHNWGGDIGATEMYLAHFMGAGGATAFLKARDSNPLQSGAVLFPDAARTNRAVFYNTATGRPKSLDEIHAFFDRKFQIEEGAEPVTQLGDNTAADAQNSDTQKQASAIFLDTAMKDTMNAMLNVGLNTSARSSFTRAYVPSSGDAAMVPTAYNALGVHNLIANPVELLLLSQAELPEQGQRYNN